MREVGSASGTSKTFFARKNKNDHEDDDDDEEDEDDAIGWSPFVIPLNYLSMKILI
jgi:hypothetical protein